MSGRAKFNAGRLLTFLAVHKARISSPSVLKLRLLTCPIVDYVPYAVLAPTQICPQRQLLTAPPLAAAIPSPPTGSRSSRWVT